MKVDPAGALHVTKGWKVVSAGRACDVPGFEYDHALALRYMDPEGGLWPVAAAVVMTADKVLEADRVIFRLRNGYFVEVEK